MTNTYDILYAPIVWGRPDDPDNLNQVRSVNVTRLLAILEEAIGPALEPFLFEINTKSLRHTAQCVVQGVVASLDVHDYRVVCDETNNTSESIADHKLNVDIWVTPIHEIDPVFFRVWLG